MARISDVAEGLTILSKYDDDGDLCGVRAEHDEILAGVPALGALEEADIARLDELGWTWDSVEECWRRFT